MMIKKEIWLAIAIITTIIATIAFFWRFFLVGYWFMITMAIFYSSIIIASLSNLLYLYLKEKRVETNNGDENNG
jgi:hypothetical protein